MNKKSPIITIIGVPNTGKSTLFNRLIGKRKALIHSQPGMTRDIYQFPVEIMGRQCLLQDSGGFFLGNETITRAINTKILNEAKRSDLLIFLFDGKRELLGYEKDLFLELKKNEKPIIPVVNKVDNPEKFILPPDYYSLKLDYVLISAEHNIGIEDLLTGIASKLDLKGNEPESFNNLNGAQTRISVVGKPNVGKSSIINKILKNDRVIVSPIPGTTRDSVDLNIKINKKDLVLVDNAGIRKMQKIKEDTESAAVMRAGRDIKRADIIVFVIDLSQKIDRNDLYIARKIVDSAKPVIVACNKWDLIQDKNKPVSIMKQIKMRFNFLYFAPMFFTSAETGKNIGLIINKVENIHEKLNHPIKTAYLNQVIKNLIEEKKLRTENNKPFNPKYVVVESYRPFFIRFQTKSKSRLKTASEMYLKKRVSHELGLEGIPVFFKVAF